MSAPLAHRLAPKSFDDYVGQTEILAPGRPLRSMIEQDLLKSLIVWGPPGCGKTSLARLISRHTRRPFIPLNAVSATVSDIKSIVKDAQKFVGGPIVFIDEIHRFTKTQQDQLLPSVERGIITLIGATTENPYYSVVPGLVSRCAIFELKALTQDALNVLLEKGITGTWSPDAKATAVAISQGDARRLLNIVEHANLLAEPEVLPEHIKQITQHTGVAHNDDAHYDLISAYIKSMRASDPDAALYWLARLLKGGDDPRFIARRLIIFASEDIGNADPTALQLAHAAVTACDKIGMPEVRIILGQVTTYCASAPKSNASYTAINAAMAWIEAGNIEPVPDYLRSNGQGYDYPHDAPNQVVSQALWSESTQFYHPNPIGAEAPIKARLETVRNQRDSSRRSPTLPD